MSEISAKLVKELRDKTNAGIMACKKALAETNGDIEKAIKWLKEKGMSDASKKSGRETAEGTVSAAISDDKKSGAILELKCETDFVARNEDFKKFAEELAILALKEANPDSKSFGEKYSDKIKEIISKFGENTTLGNVAKLSIENGIVQKYIHGVGNIGVIAAFEVKNQDIIQNEEFISMTMGVCMHIAAMSPEYLSRDEIPESIINEQKEIFSKQAKESGKPDNVIEKMIMGQLNKYYAEVCLLDQTFVKDQKKKVSDYIQEVSKKLNDGIKLKKYIRLQLGE